MDFLGVISSSSVIDSVRCWRSVAASSSRVWRSGIAGVVRASKI